MKNTSEEFKAYLPREIFKAFLSIYLAIFIFLCGDIPFAERLNGGKEIATIVILLVGYVILIIFIAKKHYDDPNNKAYWYQVKAATELGAYFFIILLIIFILCYSIYENGTFSIIALAISIVSQFFLLVGFCYITYYGKQYNSPRESDEDCTSFLGFSAIGIFKHITMVNIIFWIYYGAVINSSKPYELRHGRFAIAVKITGAVFTGLYTFYVSIFMLAFCCGGESPDVENKNWFLLNRLTTIGIYLTLCIYLSTSSVIAIIVFAVIYMIYFFIMVYFAFIKLDSSSNPNKQPGSVVPQSPRPTEGDDNEQNANGGLRTERTSAHLPPLRKPTN